MLIVSKSIASNQRKSRYQYLTGLLNIKYRRHKELGRKRLAPAIDCADTFYQQVESNLIVDDFPSPSIDQETKKKPTVA